MKLFQLKYLFWKNWLIRLQQKVWLSVELLLPCFMLLLIMLVNGFFSSMIRPLPGCYQTHPTPLPSAGALPFMQGVMCGQSLPVRHEGPHQTGFTSSCESQKPKDGNIALWDRHKFAPALYADAVAGLIRESPSSFGANFTAESTLLLLKTFNVFSSDFSSFPSYASKFGCNKHLIYDWPKSFNTPPRISARFPMKTNELYKSFIERIPDENKFTCAKHAFNRKTYRDCVSLFVEEFSTQNISGTMYVNNAPTQICTLLTGHVLVSPSSPVTNRLVHHVYDGLKNMKTIRELLRYFGDNADKLSDSLVGTNYTAAITVLSEMTQSPASEIIELLPEALFTAADQLLRSMNTQLEPIRKILSLFRIEDRFIMVENDAELIETAACLQDSNMYIGGVDFKGLHANSDQLPPHTTYKLRMSNMLQIGTFDLAVAAYGYVSPQYDQGAWSYIFYGFNYLQESIDRAIIQEQTGRQVPVGVYLQPFPTPCFLIKLVTAVLVKAFTPTLMIISWSFFAAIIIKNVTYEKEKGLKEYMKVIGLGTISHWIGWLVQYFSSLLIATLLFTTVLKIGNLMPQSNFFLLMLLFFLFGTATITQSFLISAFFDTATKASVFGGFLYLLFTIPAIVLPNQPFGYWAKTASCLLSQAALSFGISHISAWEGEGSGLQFSNMINGDSIVGNFDFYSVIGMLCFDTVFYFVLTLYIEAIKPGKFGIAKPFYFPLTPHFWMKDVFGVAGKGASSSDRRQSMRNNGKKENIEPEPEGLTLGVQLNNLKKVYSNGNVAVDGISLNFYESQITSFLGHNGAGKTTTLSILTGIFSPTSGSASVYGLDVRRNMDQIRQSIGMCPQHNVLHSMLTVKEQLVFAAGIKGVQKKDIFGAVSTILEDIGLLDKQDHQIKTLSGGMKRKLSVAIALLGDSKVVILDEPTAGVDPFARRSIWELLLKYKQGRTIILSTHHMDEADILGDRLAIIASGKLLACGSSLFLKKRFGSGSSLTVTRAERVQLPKAECSNTGGTDDHVEIIANAIKKYINYSDVTHVGRDMVFSLMASDAAEMLTLCKGLDENSAQLGISGYGISDATMEQVFLKVNALSTEKVEVKRGILKSIGETFQGQKVAPSEDVDSDEVAEDTKDSLITTPHPDVKKLTGLSLLVWQFITLLLKRMHKFRRNLRGTFVEIILPVSLVALFGLLLTQGKDVIAGNSKELLITPWIYGSQSYPNVIFLSDKTEANDQNAANYINQAVKTPGLGTACMGTSPTGLGSCSAQDSNWENFGEPNPEKGECSCGKEKGQVCPKFGNQPPRMTARTGDTLVNVTQSHINDYLIWNADTNHRALWTQQMSGFSIGNSNPHQIAAGESQRFVQKFAEMKQSFIGAAQKLNITLPAADALNVNGTDFESLLESLDKTESIKIWYNNIGFTSTAAYLNVLSNSMLRNMLPSGKDAKDYGISVYSQPLRWTDNELNLMQQDVTTSKISELILIPLIVMLAFSIIPASFVLFVVDERVTQAKHLQLVSGVSKLLYWLSNFVWDLINYIFPAVLTVGVLRLFQMYTFTATFQLAVVVFTTLMLYGVAAVALMYPATFMFRVPAMAFVLLTSANFLGGLVIFMLVSLAGGSLTKRFILGLFPPANLFVCLMQIALPQVFSAGRPATSDDVTYNMSYFLKWEALGIQYAAFGATILLGFLLLILIEYHSLIFACCQRFGLPTFYSTHDLYMDSDVAAEKQLVQSDVSDDFAVKFNGVGKTYITRNCGCFANASIVAVDNLFTAVRHGECFGLVGLNGAGKTSTFKMLTGEESIGEGEVTCYGHNVKFNMRQAHTHIGYCPQFDALNNYLTGREHLAMYARLRGIHGKDVNAVVNWAIDHMNLKAHQYKISKQYSGGNKRKLSTAIALLGNPDLLLLDEPSSGMDPKARRYLWDRVLNVTKTGRSVILTTHSMEECEALCDRIGIMVDGNLECVGSVQHLKTKFASGYKLTVQLEREADAAEFGRAATEMLGGSRVTDEHGATLQLHVGGGERLADALAAVAALRRRFALVDYSIAQTSLDDVFVSFAQAADRHKHHQMLVQPHPSATVEMA